MSSRAERIVDLSPEKRLLLELLQKQRQEGQRQESPRPAQAVPADRLPRSAPFSLLNEEDRAKLPPGLEDAYPLAMAQLGMLYHLELSPDDPTPAYHNVNSWRIRAVFDAVVFEEAVQRIVAAQPSLRTSFDLTGYSEPVQLVHQHARLPIRIFDLRALPPALQDREIEAFIRSENRHLIDLTQAPLLRFFIHRWTDETFQFTLTESHAIFDGWSLTSTLSDIFTLYFALLRGEEAAAPPPPEGAYRDFVLRERQLLGSAECRAYWDRVLSDCNIVKLPRWPAAYRRARGSEDRKFYFSVDPEVVTGLRRVADLAGVPFKSVLLASYYKALSIVSGYQDLVLGLVCNARPEERDGERLRGLFLNPLPLRVGIPRGSWIDLVQATFEAELEMLPYRVYPLAALQRRWGRDSLFEVSFTYINFHSVGDLLRSGDLELVDLETKMDLSVTHFTLSVLFRAHPVDPSRLALLLEYDDRELNPEQVSAIYGYFDQILRAMVEDPDARHDTHSFVSEEHRRQLAAWNDTSADYPEDRCVHELFAERARLSPEAVAVSCGRDSLTYRDLDERAERLAGLLAGCGVGPDVGVAVLFERSPEMVVAILAVLKAGGAYVPLDPSYPGDRLACILEEANPPVVLTQERLAARLPETAARVVCLGPGGEPAAAESRDEARRTLPAQPDNLAYVIYTSGSTGRPKGVMISHRGLVNYLSWAIREYRAGEAPAPVHSSIGFDLTVTSLLAPLLAGSGVELLPEEAGVEGLAAALRRGRFGLVKITPAHLEVLNRLLPAEEAAGRAGVLVIGGEALWSQALDFWREHAPATRLINEYGPTETVVGCSVFEAAPGQLLPEAVPIGRPIANARTYLLDADLEPVPVGAPGEIFIGGVGLARGYLANPRETAVRFVPDPLAGLAGEPGGRLYRTGDLARHLPDGTLEFLGRTDHQVKIRGYRIELGEIEAVLSQHPDVREAVVLAREDAPGEKRLVAYVVTVSSGLSNEDLRTFVAARLPEYMIPSYFVCLGALPLTPNGKVDRRALPAPDHVRSDLEGAFLLPRNPIEEVLCGIWSDVLGLEQVGIYDNFFRLGGHSLLATQALSRVRRAFRVELPLQALFESPTVAGLAVRVDQWLQKGVALEAPPIERAPRSRDLPLSFSQQRLWFLNRLMPKSTAYNLPTALLLEGQLRIPVLKRCLDEVVRRHEVLRTTFDLSADGPVQIVAPFRPASLPEVDLGALPEALREPEVERLVNAEAERCFDLALGPLLRVTLLRLGPEHNVLLVTMHHIVSDGWSRGVLVRETSALYEAFSAGRPSPFTELSIQYADFAVWQRQWLSGEVLRSHLSYWRDRLEGAPALLELPTDRPRPAVQSSHGAGLDFELRPGPGERIKTEARRQGVTLFMFLLAGFKVLLYRLTGQPDLVVGSPIANRNRIEIEGLIGFFVNTLVLRTRLTGRETFEDLLRSVREMTLGAYAHQDLPFEKLVDELELDRDVSHSPLFQVLFALQNAPRRSLELSGLTLGLLPSRTKTARFDLTLSLEERRGGLSGSLEYNTDLFDASTLMRLLEHYQTLLAALAERPKTCPADAPLLSASEQHQLLSAWNDTGREAPETACFHQIFERLAAEDPDRVALLWRHQRWTYAELNSRADQLADRLRRLGVGPDVLVGLCLERSPELLVGLLGIAKAGGAYVPLDPAYPQARLAYMLRDSAARVVVTRAGSEDRVPVEAVTVVAIGDGQAPAAEAPGGPESRPVQVTGQNLAYVIHTSGSTGQPKGVAVPHSALTNFLRSMAGTPGLQAGEILLAVTSLSFDIAALELLLPLTVAATVDLADREVAADGARLAERLRESGATMMQGTPATWRLLAEAGWQGKADLRTICGGEAMPPALASWLAERTHSVWNLYGPTETTIWSTLAPISAPVEKVTIGLPIEATRAYLLDAGLQPVPIGVPADLYIAGAGVARGYLGRPAETAQVFLPDPFGEPGTRMYRTGDLARRLADGRIESLGRLDQQVKLRGFRIELGEIEAVLGRHPSVAAAAVVAREETPGDKRLIAYFSPQPEASPTVEELRGFLLERLPEYMVPALFVRLEALPLTPNGKVDRRALPAPGRERPDLAEAPVAPRTELEEAFVEIWRQVLRLEEVGVHDNFFDLGGDSLLLVQVQRRQEVLLGRELPLTLLFQYPTVSALAAHLEAPREEDPALLESEGRAQARGEAARRQRLQRERRRATESQEAREHA